MKHTLIVCLALFLGSCAAPVGVSGSTTIPKDSAATCRAHCGSIGMELGAVAIIANNVGCVCQLKQRSNQSTASVVPAGMATVMMQGRQQSQQQQRTPIRPVGVR